MVEPEKRQHRRYSLQLPLSVCAGGSAPEAQTRNISAGGVFFLGAIGAQPGTVLEFELVLPREITLTDPLTVRCKGRVVRVDQHPGQDRVGIAAQIESYEFVNTGHA
jgi:PilZ domain-containing protein